MVAAKHGVHHNDHEKLHIFITKGIKADFLNKLISSIEVNLSVMEPYSFKNATVAFITKLKKQKRDHPSQISRVGPSNIREIIQKRKSTRAQFKSYNKRCHVPFKRRGSAPKKLTPGKWIE